MSYMNIAYRVLQLIMGGATPAAIKNELGITHYQYYKVISELEAREALSRLGDLPTGAVTEVCPPPEITGLFATAIQGSGITSRTLASARVLCTRYGLHAPPAYDERYTRSQWQGQFGRRVDFDHDGVTYMVYGALVPRTDKRAWDKAAPVFRLIYIESDVLKQPLLRRLERGRPVSLCSLTDELFCAELYVGLSLAVAWVNESRAVLVTTVRGETSE